VLESVLISDLHEKGSTGGRLMVGSGGVWGEDRQSMRNTFTSNCWFFLAHRRDALPNAEREGPWEHAENFLVIFTKTFSPSVRVDPPSERVVLLSFSVSSRRSPLVLRVDDPCFACRRSPY